MTLQISARPLSGSIPTQIDAPLTADERRRIARRLGSALAAGALLGAGLLHRQLVPGQGEVAALLLAVGAVIAAAPVFWAGFVGFLARDPGSTVDQLVSLAVVAAIAVGDFETAILVPLIMEIGHFLEERSILGARAAIEGLKTLRPSTASRVGPNGEETVPVDQLRPGDHIRVRPGETFPADGCVVRGTSAVDQSTMTGESVAEEVADGSQVFAGTLNLSGVLDVDVTALADATALGRVVELLRKAEQSKPPVVRLIESYAAYYLPAVLLMAAAALVWTHDLTRAIALLVVSCPCALVLASSAAMTAALATGARLGILIKSTSFLERLGDIDTLIVDKTGTVTTGQLEVIAVYPLAAIAPDELLAEAAMCAAGSRHPVSRGIRAAAAGLKITEAEVIEEVPGRGVSARHDGAVIRLGSAAWFRESGFQLPSEPAHAGPVVWVARDQVLVGYLLLADRPRPGSREAIQTLHGLGVTRTLLMTGDRTEVAAHVAQELGVDVWLADCLPEAKLAVVGREKAAGRGVMVVGDGVNDALALHAADVGVAMGAMGSDVAVKSADIALMGSNLGRLPQMIRLGQQTRRIVDENVLLAIGTSVIIMTAAALGFIGPLAGAVVQNVGTFAVVVNSARLLRFEAPALEEDRKPSPNTDI